MSDSAKTSTRVILQRVTTKTQSGRLDQFILFMGSGRAQMELPLSEWQEMGCPEAIVVTIERGEH